MVDLRKVQVTLTGAFFVCLPRVWAERYGLRKGTIVALADTSEGKLAVDPKKMMNQPRGAPVSASDPILHGKS